MGLSNDDLSMSKLLIFDGKTENYLVWAERFQTYLECKGVTTDPTKVDATKMEDAKRLLYREIIMHLDNTTLQSIITKNDKDGFSIWRHLQTVYGRIKTCQIVDLWQEMINIAKSEEETTTMFLNKFENIIFKLQSVDEKVSENLKIAILLRALPTDYDAFKAAVQFQELTYQQLKDKVIEKAINIDVQATTTDDIAANVNKFRRKPKTLKSPLHCTNCGRDNHTVDRCFAKGGPRHNNTKQANRNSAFSGVVLTAVSVKRIKHCYRLWVHEPCNTEQTFVHKVGTRRREDGF